MNANDRPLEFESLLSETSTKLLNLPAGEVDEEVEHGLRRIVDAWEVDRATLYRLSKDEEELQATHSRALEGIEPLPDVVTDELWPYAVDLLRREGTWKVSRFADLPAEATHERQYFLTTGIQSGLAVSLRVGGRFVGVIMIVTFGRERTWSVELVQRLRLLGEVFENALIRKRFREDLLAQEHFSANVIESLPGYFFMLNEEGRSVRWNKNVEKAFFDNYGDPGRRPITSAVLPEDRPRFERAIQKGFEEGQMSVEYLRGIVGGNEAYMFATARRAEIGGRKYLLGLGVDMSARKKAEDSLREAYSEIKGLKEQLQSDYSYLKEEIELDHDLEQIVGKSDALKYVLYKVKQIASTDTTVLILGETGTGKELLARAVHNLSPRKDRPLVKVLCSTLPANLIESELFGHEKGAFTGAHSRHIGRFEIAKGTTIFLDEIGELPLELQAKLLRVIEDGEFERLGGSRTIKVDVRIVSATNRNLEDDVRKGRFREDLWYRLSVFPITVPPLRERQEDIPLLVHSFVVKFGRKLGKTIKTVPQKAMKALQEYPWPGNVRELENVIERAVINSQSAVLHLADRLHEPQAKDSGAVQKGTLQENECDYIIQTLKKTHWRISGEKGAAALLGLNPSTLRSRMRKLGIRRP